MDPITIGLVIVGFFAARAVVQSANPVSGAQQADAVAQLGRGTNPALTGSIRSDGANPTTNGTATRPATGGPMPGRSGIFGFGNGPGARPVVSLPPMPTFNDLGTVAPISPDLSAPGLGSMIEQLAIKKDPFMQIGQAGVMAALSLAGGGGNAAGLSPDQLAWVVAGGPGPGGGVSPRLMEIEHSDGSKGLPDPLFPGSTVRIGGIGNTRGSVPTGMRTASGAVISDANDGFDPASAGPAWDPLPLAVPAVVQAVNQTTSAQMAKQAPAPLQSNASRGRGNDQDGVKQPISPYPTTPLPTGPTLGQQGVGQVIGMDSRPLPMFVPPAAPMLNALAPGSRVDATTGAAQHSAGSLPMPQPQLATARPYLDRPSPTIGIAIRSGRVRGFLDDADL